MLKHLTDLPVRHGTLVISDLEHFPLEHFHLRNSLYAAEHDTAAASDLRSLLAISTGSAVDGTCNRPWWDLTREPLSTSLLNHPAECTLLLP